MKTREMVALLIFCGCAMVVATDQPHRKKIQQVQTQLEERRPNCHETKEGGLKTAAQFLLAAASNLEEKEQIGHKPMMSDNEIAHLTGAITAQDAMLEFGSGGSTTTYSQLAGTYVSIEHDQQWCGTVKNILATLPKKNVDYHCVPWDPVPAYCNSKLAFSKWLGEGQKDNEALITKEQCASDPCNLYKTYTNTVDGLATKKFNKILVDGRCRVCVAYKVKELLAPGGLLYVHDYVGREDKMKYESDKGLMTTPGYGAIEHEYTKVGTVDTLAWFTPKGTGTVQFTK